MSYGPDVQDVLPRAAAHVDLGLAIPRPLPRTDHVIE